jgi:hypothetical protein
LLRGGIHVKKSPLKSLANIRLVLFICNELSKK